MTRSTRDKKAKKIFDPSEDSSPQTNRRRTRRGQEQEEEPEQEPEQVAPIEDPEEEVELYEEEKSTRRGTRSARGRKTGAGTRRTQTQTQTQSNRRVLTEEATEETPVRPEPPRFVDRSATTVTNGKGHPLKSLGDGSSDEKDIYGVRKVYVKDDKNIVDIQVQKRRNEEKVDDDEDDDDDNQSPGRGMFGVLKNSAIVDTNKAAGSNPFAQNKTTTSGSSNPFAQSKTTTSGSSNPFGTNKSTTGTNPFGTNPFGTKPFGTNKTNATGSNPFGTNPFGANKTSATGSNPFGTNPFGANKTRSIGSNPFVKSSVSRSQTVDETTPSGVAGNSRQAALKSLQEMFTNLPTTLTDVVVPATTEQQASSDAKPSIPAQADVGRTRNGDHTKNRITASSRSNARTFDQISGSPPQTEEMIWFTRRRGYWNVTEVPSARDETLRRFVSAYPVRSDGTSVKMDLRSVDLYLAPEILRDENLMTLLNESDSISIIATIRFDRSRSVWVVTSILFSEEAQRDDLTKSVLQ